MTLLQPLLYLVLFATLLGTAHCANKGHIFASLSEQEQTDLVAFLEQSPSLGLTPWADAAMTDNYIFSMEVLPPLKAEALAYLGNLWLAPARFAKVTIYRGSVPIVTEYKVGPLPIGAGTTITAIRDIRWNDRLADTKEYDAIAAVVNAACSTLNLVTTASYDGRSCNADTCGSKCLLMSDTAPRGHNNSTRESWLWFTIDVSGTYAHPVGLEFRIKHDGTNTAAWKINKVIYNGQIFSSPSSLLSSYKANKLKKTAFPSVPAETFSSLKDRGTPFPSETAPPQHSHPNERFVVEDNHVSWLGWSFNYNVRPWQGMALWDIAFKGERIVYELSLQEASASYSGKVSAVQATTAYYDSAWGMGMSTSPLVVGIDCPMGAQLFSHKQWSDGEVVEFPDSICVFEQDMAVPLRRHYDYLQGYYGGLASTVLVIRTIVSVYNYDYVYDYIFHLNGVVEIRCQTSGYLQTAFWSAAEEVYGNRIQQFTMGSVHEHLLHYKVDVDVAGTKNSFQKLGIARQALQPAWSPVWFTQKRLDPMPIKTEKGIEYAFNKPGYFLVYNKDTNNTWGHNKAYRIATTGFQYNILPDTAKFRNAAWSKYQLAVTKHKDSEPASSLIWDQTHPGTPYMTFDSFLDNESIENEDIVAWVTVGLLHIPHAEDIPVTTTAGNSVSVFIRPFNYFDECPTMNLKWHLYEDSEGQTGMGVPPPQSCDK